MHMRMCTYTHIYIIIYIYTYAHCIYIYIHKCICKYVHVVKKICTCTRCVYICRCICTTLHAHVYVNVFVYAYMYDVCIYSQSISAETLTWGISADPGSQSIRDAPADETNDELLSWGADFPNWAVRAGNLEGDAWHFRQVGLLDFGEIGTLG